MNSIHYKVIFKGKSEDIKKKPNLTFNNIRFKLPLRVPSHIILELKKLSDINRGIINFQNIEEVIKIGSSSIDMGYNYYFVLLYTKKNGDKKEGLLIGNIKNKGDIIIGIWPFNTNIEELTPEKIQDDINNLVKNPHEYDNICLIN
ncbi:MAG: hypothetical protein ACTSR8_17305 [Promethearchaeota archaeon]